MKEPIKRESMTYSEKKQLVKQISETGVKVEIIIKEKNLWARLPKALKEVEEFKYQRSWDERKLDFKKHY